MMLICIMYYKFIDILLLNLSMIIITVFFYDRTVNRILRNTPEPAKLHRIITASSAESVYVLVKQS